MCVVCGLWEVQEAKKKARGERRYIPLDICRTAGKYRESRDRGDSRPVEEFGYLVITLPLPSVTTALANS